LRLDSRITRAFATEQDREGLIEQKLELLAELLSCCRGGSCGEVCVSGSSEKKEPRKRDDEKGVLAGCVMVVAL